MRVTRDSIMVNDKLVALSIVLICFDFKEEGKPEYPEKTPRSTGEINCGNSLTRNDTPDLVSVVRGTKR